MATSNVLKSEENITLISALKSEEEMATMTALKSEETFTLTSRKAAHLRLFMYILTIALQSVHTCLSLVWTDRVKDDPLLVYYYPFWPKFFTIWTIILQIIYASIGIYCETVLLNNAEGKSTYYNSMTRFRNKIFSAILWPSSWVCSTIFWFFYYYDNNMICIELLNKIGNKFTLHLGHTFTLVTGLWEALLQPRPEPRSHRTNVIMALSVVAIYIIVLWHTFLASGTWIYPFYDIAYGTIYFPLLHFTTFVLVVAAYYAQWPISRLARECVKKVK